METTRFTAANGREVTKFVTDSNATGYVDAGIPLEAIQALHRRIRTARGCSQLHIVAPTYCFVREPDRILKCAINNKILESVRRAEK